MMKERGQVETSEMTEITQTTEITEKVVYCIAK